MVHCGELKVKAFKENVGLLSRVAEWYKEEIGVSFKLKPQNTSGKSMVIG